MRLSPKRLAPKRLIPVGLFSGAAALILLAGCSLPPPSAEQRHEAAYDVPENRPHPPGVISSFPPADMSSTPLRCYPNGQDTVCTRGNN